MTVSHKNINLLIIVWDVARLSVPNKVKVHACIVAKLLLVQIPWWSFPMAMRVCSLPYQKNSLNKFLNKDRKLFYTRTNWSKEIVQPTLHKILLTNRWIIMMFHKINGWINNQGKKHSIGFCKKLTSFKKSSSRQKFNLIP